MRLVVFNCPTDAIVPQPPPAPPALTVNGVRVNDSFLDRYWAKVAKGPGCWTWMASLDSCGYGRLHAGGSRRRNITAHRIAYELAFGEIPDGLEIDHLCRNRACVNPDHLEAVTRTENNHRMWATRRAA